MIGLANFEAVEYVQHLIQEGGAPTKASSSKEALGFSQGVFGMNGWEGALGPNDSVDLLVEQTRQLQMKLDIHQKSVNVERTKEDALLAR